eukprot:TRINITY_DN46335_c0_g1_i1.p1 TRINITY_DN46335_c0_g1~~TRINITY_DN46335_c0_g1_i1.p1  ORF type:complete len:261 (-),score=74.23 TRINITY_DN46335_c0_g1_i1:42-773(-)
MTTGLALVEAFNEWHWASNCFHDHVVNFALQHREHLLATAPGEHSHLVHGLHAQFREQVEGFVQGFLDHHGATMETLAEALEQHKDSDDLCTRFSIEVVTDEIFALLEYEAFLRTMLRALADEGAAGRPDADETLQAMAAADVPEAQATLAEAVARRAENQVLYDGEATGLAATSAAAAAADAATDSVAAASGTQVLQVQLPEGMREGEALDVTAPDGRLLRVLVPPGVAPGALFDVEIAASS